MENLHSIISTYLEYVRNYKRLDEKTLKAYRIDLKQFNMHSSRYSDTHITKIIEDYISNLHKQYKPKTVKRKIASLKALFRYMEYKNITESNPFNKIQVKFREPAVLPKTIPLHLIEALLSVLYKQKSQIKTTYDYNCTIRDIAVIELLFATGMRISELCTLRSDSVDLVDQKILIFGKGRKERQLQISNPDVLTAIKSYYLIFQSEIKKSGYYFVNRLGRRLSEQSVRNMISKYTTIAAIDLHITPHMFRHSFATFLLEEDVDIRYIQEMLGHSSINVTEIYTHVAMSKQKLILATKHPRNKFNC